MTGKLKLLFEQTCIIAFLSLVGISIENLIIVLSGRTLVLHWTLPLGIVIMSIGSSIPTLLLYKVYETTGIMNKVLVALHCLIVYVIVMVCGFVFGWYSNLMYFLITSAIYLCVYIGVWVATILFTKHDEKLINEALSKIADEE